MASNSSKKRMQGAAAAARWNSSRTAASLAPMYLLSSSGPLTDMKRMPVAAAAQLTACVLPQPGGPYSSTPVRRRSGAEDTSAAYLGGAGAGACVCGWGVSGSGRGVCCGRHSGAAARPG
jgi:hypothetical protein